MKNLKQYTPIILLIAFMVFLAITVGCSDSDRTVEVLRDQGYTNIETHGRDWFGCSNSDSFCTQFTATGPTGRRVTGAVGCGFGCGKGCTVRIR